VHIFRVVPRRHAARWTSQSASDGVDRHGQLSDDNGTIGDPGMWPCCDSPGNVVKAERLNVKAE